MSLPASEHAEVDGSVLEEGAGWTPEFKDDAQEPGPLASLAITQDTRALQSELLEGEVARARRYLEDARAPATRRGYASDECVFRAWCAARDLSALPATPAVVAVFLSAMAAGDPGADPPRPPKKVSTLSRYLAAINGLHRRSGLRTPGEQDGGHQLRDVFLGIRNRHSVRPDQKTALTADRLRALLAATPGKDVRAVRDRALLPFGMTSALRRSEIVALQVADVVIAPEGLRVFIARSKTDQERRGTTIAIPGGTRIRPYFEGIVCMARTGAQWRYLPDECGKWNSVFRRYRRWLETGVFDAMLMMFAEAVERDTSADMIDSTVVRAHHCAVGLKKGIRTSRRSGGRVAGTLPSSTRGAMDRSGRSASS